MQYDGKIGDAFNEWITDRFLAVSLEVNDAAEAQYAREAREEKIATEIPQLAHVLEQHGIEKKEAIAIEDTFDNLKTIFVESYFRKGFEDGFKLAAHLI
jgi:hypothetical protein